MGRAVAGSLIAAVSDVSASLLCLAPLALALGAASLAAVPASAVQSVDAPGASLVPALPADIALEFAVRDACAEPGRPRLELAGPELAGVPAWRARAARIDALWRAEWIGAGALSPGALSPEIWLEAAGDEHPHVRRLAWRGLAQGRESWAAEGAVLEALLADARDPWEPLRVAATGALGQARGAGVEQALLAALDDPASDVVWQAALAWPERWGALDEGLRASLPARWLAPFDALRDPDDRFSTLLLHGWRSAWPADFWSALWPAGRAVGLEPERRALLAAGLLTAVDVGPDELAADGWAPHVERALELSPFAAPLFDAAFERSGERWADFAMATAGNASGRGLSRWLHWAWLGLGAEGWSGGVLAIDRDREWLEVALRVAEEHPEFGAGAAEAWRAAIDRADLWETWFEVLIRAGQRGADWAAALLIEELASRSLDRRLRVLAALGALGVNALEPQREAQLREALWGEWLTLEDDVAWEALPDLAERRPPEAARDRLASLGRFNPERRQRLGAVLGLRSGDGEARLTLQRWLAEEPFAYGRAEESERRTIARRLSGLLGHLHRGFPAESGESAAELLEFAIGRDADLGRSAVRVLEDHPERRALLFGQLREGVELEIRAEALRAIVAARPELSTAELESLVGWARRDASRLSPRQASELLAALAGFGGEPVRALLIELLSGPDELPLFAADGLARLPGADTAAALAQRVRSAPAFELRRSALMALGAQARVESAGAFAREALDRLLGELDRLVAGPGLASVRAQGYRNAEVPEVWALLFAQCRELQVRAGRWEPSWERELWSRPLELAADDLERRFSGEYLARADARWPLTWSFFEALGRSGSLGRAIHAPLPWRRCDARGLLDLAQRARDLAPRVDGGPAGDGGAVALLEAAVIGLLGEGPRARRDLRDALEELAAAHERRGAAARAERIRERAQLLAPGRPWPA